MTTLSDGSAGSDEAVASRLVRHELLRYLVDQFPHSMLADCRFAVEGLVALFACHVDRVHAEAVAQERQRITALIWAERSATDGDLIGKTWNSAIGAAATLAAAGSVPVATPTVHGSRTVSQGAVATPAEPQPRCGEKRPQSSAGAYWLNAGQYDSVALCCDEPADHADDHRCDEGKPGHDTWPNNEARSVAEPSVGTGTPAQECGCTACTPEGPIDGKCRCDVCIRSAIWHPESICICQLCTYARSLAGTPAGAVSGRSGHAERQEPATWQLDTTSLDADVRTERDEWRELAERACAENESLTAEVARYRAAIEAPTVDLAETGHPCPPRELGNGVVSAHSCRLEADGTFTVGYDGQCQNSEHSGRLPCGNPRHRLDVIQASLAAALGDGK